MKKLSFLSVLLFASIILSAQTKFITKNGNIEFYSHTSMEDIKATNNQVASILDIGSGEIIFVVLMKSFKFDRSLMEEHFNENYVESDKFPKANFKGKITNLEDVNFKKDGIYNVTIEGDMTIHGVTNPMKETGTLEIKGENIIGKSKFLLDPQEYNIVIPGVVKEKFANKMEITVEMNYSVLKK